MTQFKNNVLISCALLLVYIISVVTGELKTIGASDSTTVHEWIGLISLAGLAVHIGIYWGLISQSCLRLIQIPWKHKIFALLNIAIFVTALLTIYSGIIITPQLGFGEMNAPWRHLHHVAPKFLLLLVLLHAILKFNKIKILIFSKHGKLKKGSL